MSGELDTSNPPYRLVRLAHEADGDVDAFLANLELDDGFAGTSCTRDQARQIIQFAVREAENDAMAFAPSGVGVLESKANTFLSDELDRLIKEARLYRRVAEKSDEKDYEIQSTGEVLDPSTARERLKSISDQIMEIKRNLANERKASQEQKEGMTLNLGVIVANAIDNIKSGEGHYIPQTTVKQVESKASRPEGEN